MRFTLLIVATFLATATMAFFPPSAIAQIRSRTYTQNSILSRYVPAHIKPEIRSGRITGICLHRSSTQINSSGEKLSIITDGSNGNTELKYEGPFRQSIRSNGKLFDGKMLVLLDTAGRLEIEIAHTDQSIKNTTKKGDVNNLPDSKQEKSDRNVVMRFQQRPGERMTLTLASEPKSRVIQATTIWQLLIGHRNDCRSYLLPVLYKLRPGWNLLATADQVEEQLLRLAEENPSPQYARWQKLIEQLGHSSYSRREAADRELRAAGRRVLSFLGKLDKDKLDTEQRFRISRIIRSFDLIEQSPSEIAEEMRDDPLIWLAVATDDRETARHAARSALQRLLKRPIDFDPTASAEIRETQLEKIEQSITDR
ncbi:MAG: hypothetical protein JXM70_23595 [Pirellulales bacterium]|nr:hypothetical protein [Pirellulales bacterium]